MIWVTGGLGFVGTHPVRAGGGLGERCLVLPRRPVPAPSPFADLGDMVTVVQADPADLSSLRRAGGGHRGSGIVHLAAPAPGPPGTRAALVRPRVTALLHPLDAAPAWGVPPGCLSSSPRA